MIKYRDVGESGCSFFSAIPYKGKKKAIKRGP